MSALAFSYVMAQNNDIDDKSGGCDSSNYTDNIERCPAMPCEANYQCYSNICGRELKCQTSQSESKFNGIIALLGFLLSIIGIAVIGFIKLCRNRITRESLRERLAGVLTKKQEEANKTVHKTGRTNKKPQKQNEPADFVIRKNTVRASRSGDIKFNPYSLNSNQEGNQSRMSGESGSYRTESENSSQENGFKEKFIKKKQYQV